MLTKIKRWLEPPHFEGDEDKTNQTRIANTLIIYLGAALLIVIFVLIPLFAFQKIGSWVISIAVFCGLAIGRHLISKGRLQLGGTLIFAIIYLCILAMLILSGGSSNTAMFYFATVVLIAGFFLDARVVNGFTLATFVIAMGISFLQEEGLVAIPKVFVFNSFFSWLATGLGLLFMIRTRDLFVGNLQNALAHARQQNAARQQVEASLRESEEKFKAQYKGIPIPTYSWQRVDDDLILVDYNNSAFEFTQGFIVNLLGKTASAIYRDDPETYNQLTDCMRTKVNLKGERWHRLASTGERKYLAIHYAFVPPDLVMVHTEDVTERKNAETRNRIIAEVQDFLLHPCELKDIYRLVAEKVKELIGEGIVATSILDEKNRTLRMGYYHGVDIPLEKILSVIGFDPWQKEFPLDAMAEEDLSIYHNSKLGILEGGLYALMTRLVPKPACQIMEKLLRVQKIYGMGFVHKEAHLGGLIILARNDITSHIAAIEQIVSLATIAIERKRAEEEVENREKRFQALIAHGRDEISLLAADGTLLWESPSVHSTLGYAPNQFMGENIFKLMHPDDQAWTSDMYKQVVQSPGCIQEGEFRLLHADGTWRWIECSATNLLDDPSVQAIVLNYRDVTERKKAEDALRESEQKHRQLFETMSQGVIYYNASGKILSANPAAERILNLSLDQLQGKTYVNTDWKLIREDGSELPDKEHPVAMALHTGKPVERDIIGIFNPNTNAYIWLSITAIPLFNPEEKTPHQVYSTFEDITERKHVEDELRQSEAKFRAVVENSNDGILFGDANAVIKYRSPSYKRINGYNDEERVGHSGFDTVHPDDAADLQHWWVNMLEHPGISYKTEYRILHKDGNWRWIETSGQNLLSNPDLHSVVVTSRDITERKRAELELQETKNFLQQIVDTSPSMIFVVDDQGRAVFANQYIAKYYGTTPEQFVSKTTQDVHRTKTEAQEYSSDDQQVIRTRRTIVKDELNTAPNGEQHWFSTIKMPLVRSDGKVEVLGISTDITERKHAEEALQQQNRFLLALQNTTVELVSQLDLKTLLENIVKRACALLGTSAGLLDLVDPATNQLIPQVGVGVLEVSLHLPPVQPGEGLTGTIWQTGKMLVIPDYDQWSGRLAGFSHKMLGSVIGVPLLSGTQVLGVLVTGFEYGAPHHFDPAAIEIMHQFARLATVAVQNARLFSNLQAELMERKRAEASLQENEARLSAVVKTANDAILSADMHGIVISWNVAAETIFGFSEDEALGMPVDRIVPQKFFMSHRHGMEHALVSNERQIIGKTVEGIGLTKDGREFPIEMSLAEWKTQTGNFFTAIIRDISERKRAEEQIQQSEKKYRELFQVNKDGIAIFLLNPDSLPSTFVEINEAAHQMLGYTRDEMLQMTPTMLEPHLTAAQMQFRQSEFESKSVSNFETVIQHKDGHPVFTEFTAQMIQYEGKPAIMNIVRDITERKQHENELRAIATVSAALRTASARSEILAVTVQQLSNLLNCDSMSAEIIDPVTGDAVIEAAHGAWTSIIGFRQPAGTGMNAIISETMQPYLDNHVRDSTNIGTPAYLMENILAGAGVPLIAQDQLIGFLWMGRRNEITESEVRLFAAVADIAANAIHRATLHERTQKNAADLALAYDSTLEGWAHALELREQETEQHARRVVQMTSDLARTMGINEEELEHVRRGALLHDIGKMGIPDSVLLKPGTLNEREWEIMQRHPEYGYRFLERIQYLRPALDIPYCHHERWDGTGYPRGLKGEQIPLAARIFAIVDVWDALTTDRPYRAAWTKKKALAHITKQSGRHFDPKVVDAFMKIV